MVLDTRFSDFGKQVRISAPTEDVKDITELTKDRLRESAP